jgi:Cu/Ag efflux protein CusF
MAFAKLGALSCCALVLSLAACSPKQVEPAAPAASASPAMAASPMAEMSMPAASPMSAAEPVTGIGKITGMNAATGAVTLDHQAIPAVHWDAMTMQFTAADPGLLKEFKVGDAVTFELKSAAEPTIVTKLQKR